ncbi:MAG: hypothetical protein JKY38_07090, partial [Ralstonia sp.]|nr:hypothetical protein [Ralstonia sp.]
MCYAASGGGSAHSCVRHRGRPAWRQRRPCRALWRYARHGEWTRHRAALWRRLCAGLPPGPERAVARRSGARAAYSLRVAAHAAAADCLADVGARGRYRAHAQARHGHRAVRRRACHVGGNGGIKVRATELLCKVVTEDEVQEYCAAYTQLYREEAHYLERTAPWMERVGLDYVKKRIVEDQAGRGA